MKKRRLWALIMLPLLLAACAPAGEAGTTEISCPTAEGPAPDTNPMPEHPFTADAGLSAALGDYPGLVYAAAGDGDGGYRRYLLSRDGYYLSAEESVGPLYDALADTPARYYTSTRELPGGGQETAHHVFELFVLAFRKLAYEAGVQHLSTESRLKIEEKGYLVERKAVDAGGERQNERPADAVVREKHLPLLGKNNFAAALCKQADVL